MKTAMTRPHAILLSPVALASLAACETRPYYGDVGVHDRAYDVRVVFSDTDRRVIREYYRATPGACRPASPGTASCRRGTCGACPPMWNAG